MKKLTKEEINEIRDSVDIVDVIGRYIPLTKTGKNYFGVCPFHEDADPSLSVSPEKQIFSCFSCHTAGNVFNFVMEYDHVSFLEAVKVVADIAGIKIDVNVPKKTNYKNKDLYEIYNLSQKYYSNNINTNVGLKAKGYLNKRNIDSDIIKDFGIGLALKNVNKFSNILLKKEFKEKDLIESGIVVKDEKGFHDFFYDRIMFPLHDINNQVVGYSGRIYGDYSGPKYVNSKENPLFKKGEFVYNYYRAKDECRSKNTVIIMEGFMDVIRAYSVGVKNVVANMGTAFTKEHVNIIKRLASNVIICYDGDEPGNKATLACSNELINAGVVPKIVRLEEGLDPDEYIIKYGKDKFIDRIENPISVMDFKLKFFKQNKDINQTEEQAKYVNTILLELDKIEDEILREITIKKLSEETLLDEKFLRAKLNKKEVKKPIKKEIKKYSKYESAQLNLLFYMLRFNEVIKMYDNQVFYFPNQDYRLLAKEISYFYNKKGYVNEAEIMDDLDESLSKVIGIVESLNLKEEYTSELINDYINAIKENNIEEECLRISRKMQETNDEEEKQKLGQKMIELLVRRENDV